MKPEIQRYQLAVPTADGYSFRSSVDLMYCIADGNYSWLYFIEGRKYLVTKTLRSLEGCLPTELFVRIHSRSLINKMHVSQYINGAENYVRMSNGEELDVSRRSQKKLKEQFVIL
ncbi:MAG: LytTR family transcriptional regulator [Saprospiraceae bacterium]|nr:LytTR family transcriptional regulator [Saprospiraceae bacterium]